MSEDTTLRDDVGVDHLQEEADKGVKEKVQDVATPAVNGLNSPDNEISEEKENTEGEDAQQPEHEDEGTDSLQEEGKTGEDTPQPEHEHEINKPLQKKEPIPVVDGAGEQSQLDEDGEDHDTNKTTKKSQCEVVDCASSPETSQLKSPAEEHVKAHHAASDSSNQCCADVSNKTDTKDKISVKEEKPTKPFKEQRGEGDAPHIDKTETREPTITAQDTSESKPAFGYYAFAAVVVAVLAYWLLRPQPPPVQKPFTLVDVFREEMDKVQSSFPSQHKELWRRSKIHLLRHLKLSQPSEPVSLILTSGRGAEKTLGCLAQQLAAAFSTARNASALDIDGTSKTTEDSDQVKLDIDKALREAFDGGKQAVVIHRFEELPPGSTLIFYRYCDHENAAYKNVFLAFTVLLEGELEIPPNVSLGMVEEIVQEYLKEKFVSSKRTAIFNQMDVDKLSGLWSRISHLILPVSAEEMIEQHGCGGSG